MKIWQVINVWGMTLTNENLMRDETKSVTHFGESRLQFVSEFLSSRLFPKKFRYFLQKQQSYPYSGPEAFRIPDFKTVGT